MKNYGPPNPPPEAYCPCCQRLSDCCICHAGPARYYGAECQKCLPLTNEKADDPIIVEAS